MRTALLEVLLFCEAACPLFRQGSQESHSTLYLRMRMVKGCPSHDYISAHAWNAATPATFKQRLTLNV